MIVQVSALADRRAGFDRHLGFGDREAWTVFGSSFARGWDEAYADLLL